MRWCKTMAKTTFANSQTNNNVKNVTEMLSVFNIIHPFFYSFPKQLKKTQEREVPGIQITKHSPCSQGSQSAAEI